MPPPRMPPPRIDVIDISTREVVHSVQLHSTSERGVERVMMGMLTNLDTDKFCLREVLK